MTEKSLNQKNGQVKVTKSDAKMFSDFYGKSSLKLEFCF